MPCQLQCIAMHEAQQHADNLGSAAAASCTFLRTLRSRLLHCLRSACQEQCVDMTEIVAGRQAHLSTGARSDMPCCMGWGSWRVSVP